MNDTFLTEEEVKQLKKLLERDPFELFGKIVMLERQVTDLKNRYENHYHDYDGPSSGDPLDPYGPSPLQTSDPKDPY